MHWSKLNNLGGLLVGIAAIGTIFFTKETVIQSANDSGDFQIITMELSKEVVLLNLKLNKLDTKLEYYSRQRTELVSIDPMPNIIKSTSAVVEIEPVRSTEPIVMSTASPITVRNTNLIEPTVLLTRCPFWFETQSEVKQIPTYLTLYDLDSISNISKPIRTISGQWQNVVYKSKREQITISGCIAIN